MLRSRAARRLAASILAGSLLAACGSRAEPRLNVLFITIDDLRPELGCYGNPVVDTPSFDALAAQGVRFDRAYCQYPHCNPSRTSFLTGLYPGTLGILDGTSFFRDVAPETLSLPQLFRQNGYVTAHAGKIFHGGNDDPEAWSIAAEARREPRERAGPPQADRYVVLENGGQEHGDYASATRAIELLEELKDEPFFLGLGFSKPHSPPSAPEELFDLYDLASIQLPADFAPRPTVPPGFPEASVPPRNGDLFIGRDASEEEAREYTRAYYASLTFVDRQLGRVLAALERLGLRERTLIVLLSDHGYHLGEKGKWSKHDSLFEVVARVPLIVAMPGAAAGKSSTRIVELVDLFPTLCEACGLTPPPGLDGASLVPLLRDPSAAWDRPAYTVMRNGPIQGRSLRTERWRYSEWRGLPGSVLFDHDSDPGETRNLAGDPRHAAIVEELRERLRSLPDPR